jgi:hypothetical protein
MLPSTLYRNGVYATTNSVTIWESIVHMTGNLLVRAPPLFFHAVMAEGSAELQIEPALV